MNAEQYYAEMRSQGYVGFMAIKEVMKTTPEGGNEEKLKTIQFLVDMYYSNMTNTPVPEGVPEKLMAVNFAAIKKPTEPGQVV